MINIKSFFKPALGIGTEILYTLIIMIAAFLICLVLIYWR